MKINYTNIKISSYLLASSFGIIGVIGMLSSSPVSAATLSLISRQFDGNDCAGYFGDNFDSCQIFIMENGNKVEISPVIAKFETDDNNKFTLDANGTATEGYLESDKFEVNDAKFPSIDGTEWSFTNDGENKTGTWNYTRGTDDPGIRYWAAKGGNFFTLFWKVEETHTQSGGVCDDSNKYFTLDCLSKAEIVNTGTWVTPDNKGLSHITFYDSEDPVDSGPSEIPEPNTTAALGLFALGGLRFLRKKK